MWNWVEAVHLISPSYQVFDGTDDTINCTELNHIQWTYNTGIFLYGAAVMWNQTEGSAQDAWRTRVQGLIDGAKVFFYNNTQIMYEVACEPIGNCNTDQLSFKAYLARWMAGTTKVAPWTHDQILPYLAASASAAAESCSGGEDGVTCGTQWYIGHWDNSWGVGQQMSALEVIQSNLIDAVQGPVGNKTGGTSVGNPSAGTGGDTNPGAPTGAISTGDKAGAGIVTAIIIVGILGGAWYVFSSSCLDGTLLTTCAGGWWHDHRVTEMYSTIATPALLLLGSMDMAVEQHGKGWTRTRLQANTGQKTGRTRTALFGVRHHLARFFEFHLQLVASTISPHLVLQEHSISLCQSECKTAEKVGAAALLERNCHARPLSSSISDYYEPSLDVPRVMDVFSELAKLTSSP